MRSVVAYLTTFKFSGALYSSAQVCYFDSGETLLIF